MHTKDDMKAPLYTSLKYCITEKNRMKPMPTKNCMRTWLLRILNFISIFRYSPSVPQRFR